MGFATFMASTTGRAARVVAGLALIALGLMIGGALGVTVSVVGIVPFAAGVFDVCIFAPLFRAPFRGAEVRSQ